MIISEISAVPKRGVSAIARTKVITPSSFARVSTLSCHTFSCRRAHVVCVSRVGRIASIARRAMMAKGGGEREGRREGGRERERERKSVYRNKSTSTIKGETCLWHISVGR